MTSNVPEIRFKGYEGKWELRKLGELGDVTKLAGFEFTKHIKYSDKGNIIALRGLNVKNNTLVLNDVKYIDNSEFSKLSRSKLFEDDILFTYVGTVGQLAIVPENDKYYLAPNVSRIRLTDKGVPMFIVQLMGSDDFYNKVINPLIATSSQPALSMENIRVFKLILPKYLEQQAIGFFFKELDDRIALQQTSLEFFKETKQGFLQKMFPKKGETTPEIRFEGFEGEWEEALLINSLIKNSLKNKELKVKNVESVSNKTGFTKQTDQFEGYSVASADLSNYYIIKGPQFAYNPSRINVGSIAYKHAEDEVSVVSPLYVSFSTDKNIADVFLWYWFKSEYFERQRQLFS